MQHWMKEIAAAIVAVGSLLAIELPAQAQSPKVTHEAQAGRSASYNIPAQPLAQALTAFGQQAGVQLAVGAAVVAGKTSTAISGLMTAEQALQRLLTGTGVSYRFTSPTSVTIFGGPDTGGVVPLDPVQVQGYPVPAQAMIDNLPPPYAGGQVATGGQFGLLGNRPVMDTPFNTTNYTAQKVQDQQAKTVTEALIDNPSVRSVFTDGTPADHAIRVRGFPMAAGDIAYGGLFGLLPSSTVMAEAAERVELLNGPSAMLFGMAPGGSVGGTLNIIPKRAADEALTQFTASYISSAQFGIAADIGRRFGNDKQFGVRFNGVFRDGQGPISLNTDERGLALVGLDYRGENVRASVDAGYQYNVRGGIVPYVGFNPGVQIGWAPNARNNWGQAWTEVLTKDLFAVARAEVDMTPDVTAYASFGAHDMRYLSLSASQIILSNINGNATSLPANYSGYASTMTGEVGLRGTANTGPIGHEFAVNANWLQRTSGGETVLAPNFATNLYNPAVYARPSIAQPSANKTALLDLSSVAIADTLTGADKRVQLTVGARWQRVATANYAAVTGVTSSYYDQSAISPSAALVFKPWSNVSIYGNFIQGLSPGIIVAPPFTNAGELFPPYKTTQYEAGIKVDWGKFTTTASLFQISRPSTITNVAANTLVLAGEQRNQGLELNVFGEPMPGVRLLGGMMLLDAVLTKTQGDQTNGWYAPFSPGVTVNLSGEWDLPFLRNLTLTGRAIYTGPQYIDTTFPRRQLPEWTRFDVGARYLLEGTTSPTGKPMALRFLAENLFDTNYYASGNSATIITVGNPLTFRVALTADF